MLIPFFLFFGLTVATAVIAYWSDNLGKKLGKKRISLLGLRPRDTATVLTIASSWGIMAFTLVVMLIVAKPLRDALFRFERLQAQNKQLQLQSNQLISQNGQIENQLTNREKRLEQVEKQASAASKNAKSQTENARKAREDAKRALEEQRLARQRETVARNQESLAKRGASEASKRAELARKGQISAEGQARLAFADLKSARSQLDENNERLKQAKGDLKQTETDLSSANERLKTATANFKIANSELDKTNGKLLNVYRASLKEYRAQLAVSRAKDEAERQRDAAQTQVDVLKKQQSDLEQNIAALQERSQTLWIAANQLFTTANQLSTRPVKVAVNQTLAARTLPPNLTAARVESHLRSLLPLAKDAGSKLLPNSVITLLQYVQTPSGEIVKLPDDEVISGAADFIAASGRSVSVRLVSNSNFAEGEREILVRFEVVEVKTAINANDVLAQTTIDSKIGDAAIFNALLSLIETGRREAIRKGINPPQTADEPNFYENGTNEQIFVALRQIERGGKTATVKIVAADDLSTVEPVRVRFDVS